MNKSIVNYAKNWEKTIQKYNEAVLTASSLLEEIEEKWDDEKKEIYQKKLELLNTLHLKAEKTQVDIIKEIAFLENSPLKRQLIGLVSQPPYFAGLDEKLLETITDSKTPNINSVLYLHEIYVEHVKLVSGKIIKLLKNQEKNSESNFS